MNRHGLMTPGVAAMIAGGVVLLLIGVAGATLPVENPSQLGNQLAPAVIVAMVAAWVVQSKRVKRANNGEK